MHELETAYLKALQRNKRMIVIIVGELPERIESVTARTVLDTHHVIRWSTDEAGRKLFWAKLKGYMYGEEIGCGCCCGKRESGSGEGYSRIGPTPNDIL